MAPDFQAPRWETRVLHLNINLTKPVSDSPSGSPPSEKDTASQSSPDPVFSEHFLKQEFPNHYSDPLQNNQPPSDKAPHPALQLQNVFNQFGLDGWEFLGIFSAGSLTLMIFKRPLPNDILNKPSEPTDSKFNDPPKSNLSESIDQRLERLENLVQGLSTNTRTSIINTLSPLASDSVIKDNVSNIVIINSAQLASLSNEESISTSRASQLLGFRSHASLLGYLSRHNYQIGLVKRSSMGNIAIYVGKQQSNHGGRSVRLWKVISVDHFDSLNN